MMSSERPGGLVQMSSYYLFEIWRERGDAHVMSMPLMTYGPWYFLSMALSLIFLIKVAAPNYMADRKALDLKPFLIVFNGLLFGGYGGFFVGASVFTKLGTEGLNCKAADPTSNDLFDVIIRLLGYVFIIGKIGDFIVPVFRVFLKKQVSDLHLLHTLFMVFIGYFGLIFYPGGVFLFLPYLDGLYYSLLHGYLVMTTPSGDTYRPSKRWSKNLALLRISIFAATLVHGLYFFWQPNCGPKSLKLVQSAYALLSVFLLSKEYKKRFNQEESVSSCPQKSS